MTKVLERSAEDEVVVACAGLTSEVGYGVAIDGEPPVTVMFRPGLETKTKRKYADFLVKYDALKFSVVEVAKEAVAPAVEPKAEEPERTVEPEKEPTKQKGFFKR